MYGYKMYIMHWWKQIQNTQCLLTALIGSFAHIVIAMAFIGPLKDPIKNKWIIDWAMLACIAVFPLAFIAGPIRHIPMFHILIDCSFGVVGLVPLYFCRKWIKELEQNKNGN